MQFVPSFEPGLLNAWIFAIWLIAPYFLAPLKIIPKGREVGNSFITGFNRVQKTLFFALHISFLLLILYSIFVPIKTGTVWFYAGLAIFVWGLIVFKIAGIPWVTTPLNGPVIKGLYRYSRHPIYIAVFLQFIGIGIASASGLFLLLVIIHIIISITLLPAEEQFCCEKYGATYREYMDRTPRWLGVPKS